MNPDNEWHKYSTYRSTHSPPRSHCLHYEIDSVWEVRHSVCFWTSLSWFCLSFVRKELGLYCCWDEILYINWRTRRGRPSPLVPEQENSSYRNGFGTLTLNLVPNLVIWILYPHVIFFNTISSPFFLYTLYIQ